MNNPVLKVLIVVAFIFSLVWTILGISKTISSEAPDFRILWSFASHLRQGENLYLSPDISIPNPYPPFTFLFYLPFTLVPYVQAQAIFVFLIFASLVVTALLSIYLVTEKVPILSFIIVLTLILFSFPVKFSLGMGQQNSIAYLLMLISYFFWRKKDSPLSGIFLALAVSLKPVLGFVVIFFLTQGAWKTIFWAFVTGLTETVSTSLISKTNLLTDWIKQALTYIPLSGRGVYYNQGFVGFISRITQDTVLINNLVILFSVSMLFIVFTLVKKKKDPNLSFSLFTITLLLLDTLSWQHHFVWLIFPFVVLTYKTIKTRGIFVSGLLILAYLLISWNYKNPHTVPTMLLSTQFYGTMILWIINVYFVKNVAH